MAFPTPSGFRLFRIALLLCLLAAFCIPVYADDAYVRQEGSSFTFGNSLVERTVVVRDGKVLLGAIKDKATGRDLLPRDSGIEEFSILIGPDRAAVGGASGGWKLVNSKQSRLAQGELQLDLTIERDRLRITRSYIIYPGSTVIREATTVMNAGNAGLLVAEPTFLSLAAAAGDPSSLNFHWMTGGENRPGQWMLKTEQLRSGSPLAFDSYDSFRGTSASFPGDGVDAKIELNGTQIWPAQGWQYVASATVIVPFDVKAKVNAGDQLAFRVNMHGNIGWDITAFDPTLVYADGESHTASKEFSNEQGKNGWRYGYVEGGEFIDLVYYPGETHNWRKKPDNATRTPFVDVSRQHPDVNQDAVRLWTAPRAGEVRITGSVCNIGNGTGSAPYGPRSGTSTYAPWYALYGRDSKQGLFIGFDYFGHWASRFDLRPDGALSSQLRVAGFRRELQPGQSFTTPWAFVGLFHDDLDNAGNELLDWQYAYLWDYTRDGRGGAYPWFPALRTLGYWYKGTGWGKPGVSWTGGNPDWPSTFRKVFRVADYMRYTGTDVYHRDWGWWDVAGDWNGPDFRTTGQYLRKYGMGQLIYAFLYTVDPRSRVAAEHPDWLLGGDMGGATLDMSRPEVVKFMQGQLNDFVQRWGDFEWRNDSMFTAERKGDPSVLLEQDQNFRRFLREFLDRYPNCAFQAVNGGGNYAGYEYIRYASNVQFSDGVVGPLRNYYSSLLFPPDKNCDNPDQWDPAAYNKATWRGLLCFNYDTTGDTGDPSKLEGIRQLNDIYHYLLAQGVVGRWVHVYRPLVAGDDPTFWFQRLSRDGKRGILIPKHVSTGPVTIRPKGLLPTETYVVSFQESDAVETRDGADLMNRGIELKSMLPGELIYLNLPLHPGSKLDKTPPAPPTPLVLTAATNMGNPGVELTWKPGADDNWVSCYEVFRNGVMIDKVAKGTYYFDHSAGADIHAQYAIRTIDGAGNTSPDAVFSPAPGRPATVIDDAPGGGMAFTGPWTHTPQYPAHANTISFTSDKTAAIDVPIEGKRVLLFSKLGADCGKFAVRIDDGRPDIVDTFSADDICGVCVWQCELPAAGKHTLHLTVLGDHTPRAQGDKVHIDGVRVEQ
ncbi:MAG: hypothetical protein ACM359_15870 [Bacillota bacterium]